MINKEKMRVKLQSLLGRKNHNLILRDRPELPQLEELLRLRCVGTNKVTMKIESKVFGDIEIVLGKLKNKSYSKEKAILSLTIE